MFSNGHPLGEAEGEETRLTGSSRRSREHAALTRRFTTQRGYLGHDWSSDRGGSIMGIYPFPSCGYKRARARALTYGIMHVYRTVCTPLLYIVEHPEARPPCVSRTRWSREEKCEPPSPLQFSPSVIRLSFAPLLFSHASSLHPSFPPARASCSSPANPLRHALACVNHAYRFSFVRASEDRSVVAHVWSLFPPALSLSQLPTLPTLFFLTESPGAVPCRRWTPFWKHIHARGARFFWPQWPSFSRFPSAAPRSVSLSLSHSSFLLPPSSFSPRPTPFQLLRRAKPSTLPPPYDLRFIAPSLPARRCFAPQWNIRQACRNLETWYQIFYPLPLYIIGF